MRVLSCSFTKANPGDSLLFDDHWSAPPVPALARSGRPRVEWILSPPLDAAVLIAPKGVESPGSDRMGAHTTIVEMHTPLHNFN